MTTRACFKVSGSPFTKISFCRNKSILKRRADWMETDSLWVDPEETLKHIKMFSLLGKHRPVPHEANKM